MNLTPSVLHGWCRMKLWNICLLALALALFCLGSPVQAEFSSVPVSGILDFSILRNGKDIGRQTIRFQPDGDTLSVQVDVRIEYKFGFVPLYLFDHHATEIWRDGKLSRLTATTRDNGDDYKVEVRLEGQSLLLSVNGEESAVEPEIIPASLWNIDIVRRQRILDPADGELMAVGITDAGPETVTIAGKDIAAQHYVMTGDFERDVWYDAAGVLVLVRFKAEDGSEIRYVLR